MVLKVLSIFGTRPEAIKMAPLVQALGNDPGISSVVCSTGQHSSMLHQVLDLFDVKADIELDVMTANQSLNGLSSRLFAALDGVLADVKPDRVLVHGDTTSAMAAALSAFHRQIPVGHVEAGLRTGNMLQPWPEEMNRRNIDVVSDMMFAPTASSRANLEQENLSGAIHVCGNTVIDALLATDRRIREDDLLRARLDQAFPFLDPGKRLLLVTGHRRENFGEGFRHICDALATLAHRADLQIVYPVHLNPNVQGPVNAALAGLDNVHLIAPQDYLHFVRLMQRAYVILTDSGGVQEEAPALGKPVLVMRNVTERPEAVAAGTVRLVGTESRFIVSGVSRLLNDASQWHAIAHRTNPYGDGRACRRILAALHGRAYDAFDPDRPLQRVA